MFPMESKAAIVQELRGIIPAHKNTVICGEVGVGKITNTLEALQDRPDVYYVGNPVDYVGMPRPKGYDKYIRYIRSLKEDLHIISDEAELLAFDFSALSAKGAVVVIDEIFGRSTAQYEKILKVLDTPNLTIAMIVGCLKNIGRSSRKFDAGVMLTNDGILLLSPPFIVKICEILGTDTPGHQAGLFT